MYQRAWILSCSYRRSSEEDLVECVVKKGYMKIMLNNIQNHNLLTIAVSWVRTSSSCHLAWLVVDDVMCNVIGAWWCNVYFVRNWSYRLFLNVLNFKHSLLSTLGWPWVQTWVDPCNKQNDSLIYLRLNLWNLSLDNNCYFIV